MERAVPPFFWGISTSAYQIEGATAEDGRGPCIWDVFCRLPGKVARGDTADVACDHYHRWREDVLLLRDLGVNAYRFSISWSRVEPNGDGRENPAGVDFYRRLVDALLEAGIEPFAALYHFDLPLALEHRGGWRSRDTVYRFADYAAHMIDRLGDGVRRWITFNEPWCVAVLGHLTGEHAPGMRDPQAALAAAHHVMLAHARAYEAMHAQDAQVQVGITLNLMPYDSPSPDPQDQDAVRVADGLRNRWYLDPVLRGSYPADILAHLEERFDTSCIRPYDLSRLGPAADFLGVNYYNPGHVVRGEPGAWPPYRYVDGPGARTEMGWEVDPDGLRRLLVRVAREYPPVPLLVLENGAAYPDNQVEDGRIVDLDRIAYIRRHLDALSQAMAEGAPVQGYFYWTLVDNFEWAFGYTKKFGLVAMDADQRRIPKESYRWLQRLLAQERETPRFLASALRSGR